MKRLMDKALNKFISRKLLTFLIATGLMYQGSLESEHWVWVAVCYISGQAAVDVVTML
jgi:hypothetical protein